MADAEAAMALALADGRVQLTIENRDLGVAVVEHLSVDWPGVAALPSAETGQPSSTVPSRYSTVSGGLSHS